MRLKTIMCSSDHCENEADGTFDNKPMCGDCADGWHEYYASQEGPDPHGDMDPTPEEQAGWAFEDKLEMYRKEI